jgi:DNA-directed RNA polymerase-3 subunit RPC5
MSVRVKQEGGSGEPVDVDSGQDDEVIREIDVHLSPALSRRLRLVQYPLQHSRQVGRPAAARVRPRHAQMQIDHPLPAAIERRGRFQMERRTFAGQTIPVQTHMCLGKLRIGSGNGGKQGTGKNPKTSMHLVPLAHISQMRPSFSHVDEDEAEEKKEAAALVDDVMEEADNNNSKVTAETKPLLFQRKETERAAMARKNSYAYKKASEDSEEWRQLTVYPQDSAKGVAYSALAVCEDERSTVLEGNVNNASYVQSLHYGQREIKNDDDADRDVAELAPPGNDLPTVCSRLTTLMVTGWPVPYSVLRRRLEDVDEAPLLRALNVCAVQVRGNFCLHSRFLPLPESLRRVRTFILLLLEEEGVIERFRLTRVYSGDSTVSPEKLLSLLQTVGKRTGSGWVLKIEDDNEFVAKHATGHNEKHAQYWQRQKKIFEKELTLYHKAT